VQLLRAWIAGLHSLANVYSGGDNLAFVRNFASAVVPYCQGRDCIVIGHSLGEAPPACVSRLSTAHE
jgi:hypothetical protein